MTLLQAFPLQGCWVGAATPAFSGWLVYLQFCEGLPLPHSSVFRVPCPLLHVFLLLLFIQFFFFLFFPLCWGQSVQGAMLIWPRVVCGSTECCLAHLVVCFSQARRSWRLVMREPPGFSVHRGVGILCVGWECGYVGVLPLLCGLSCKVYLQRLSKILL
jgi:hypothetical protein